MIKIEDKTLTIKEISKISQDNLIDLYKKGYTLEQQKSSNIINLGTSNCPTDIIQGTTKNIKSSLINLGTPGYVYKLYIKKLSDPTFTELDTYPITGKTNDITHEFSHKFDETIDSYVVKTEVIDSCIGGALLDESICTVNIILLATDICSWIGSKGGATLLNIINIFELVDAYLGIINIGFIPTIIEIFGCIDYYLGDTASGNLGTGCSY